MLNKTKNQLKLIFIISIFIVPLIAANLYYVYGHRQGGVTNNGILLTDVKNISALELISTPDSNTDLYSKSKWQVLYFASNQCDNQCKQVLYNLQQVHIALGKNINRFQRTIIHANQNQNKNLALWQDFYKNYPHMTSAFSSKDIANLNLSVNNVYLVDPLGNIILSYSINDPGFHTKLFKDSKKLLSLSKIG